AHIDRLLQFNHADRAQHPPVADVRVLGAIGVVELKQAVDMRTIPQAFVSRGVWVRPFGRLVYVMPAYIMSPDDLATLCRAIVEVVAELP
ncbi:MAG: aminotransferase class III-fold pyridoxal phosphate-dependent enzyme, partial [Betaproteobacteria bacterium]|nr:aminotransferase class III-fold pyridoxal phosphate-dependent enzyme [Betaproteobacteria bacterium]